MSWSHVHRSCCHPVWLFTLTNAEMNPRVILLTIVLLGIVVSGQVDKYSTKFDYLNVDQILRNNRLLKSYYNCLIDVGPCTQEGFTFRKTFPDALRTRCQKCTDRQKKNARKIVEFVMKHKPDMWQGFLKKYDPTGTLTKNILSDENFLG